jgi:hypothetical protein
MKMLWCAIVGHRVARLEGSSDPLLSISTPQSGLELRVDYCDRCGVLFGRVKRIDRGKVENIHLLRLVDEA